MFSQLQLLADAGMTDLARYRGQDPILDIFVDKS